MAHEACWLLPRAHLTDGYLRFDPTGVEKWFLDKMDKIDRAHAKEVNELRSLSEECSLSPSVQS